MWPQDSTSFFELMDAGNPTTSAAAVEWAESMPSNCFLHGSGDFVENHAPFRYYTKTQTTLCPLYSRPFSATPADQLSARFNLIIPNRVHDMHLVPNTTIAQRIQNGDNWAKTYLPALISSSQYQAGRTAIIITWDEGNGSDFTVPFIVVTPYTKAGGVSSVAYDHYSTLKGIEQMLGVTPFLGHAGDAGRAPSATTRSSGSADRETRCPALHTRALVRPGLGGHRRGRPRGRHGLCRPATARAAPTQHDHDRADHSADHGHDDHLIDPHWDRRLLLDSAERGQAHRRHRVGGGSVGRDRLRGR